MRRKGKRIEKREKGLRRRGKRIEKKGRED